MNHDEVNSITIPWSKNRQFKWNLLAQGLYKFTFEDKKEITVLPFFQPDLTNYPKLINKLKTCLVFS